MTDSVEGPVKRSVVNNNKLKCKLSIQQASGKVQIVHKIHGPAHNPKVNYIFEPRPDCISPIGMSTNPDGMVYEVPEGEYSIKARVTYSDRRGVKKEMFSDIKKVKVK